MQAAARQCGERDRSQWAEPHTLCGARAHVYGRAIERIGNNKEKVEVKEEPIFDLLCSLEIYWS